MTKNPYSSPVVEPAAPEGNGRSPQDRALGAVARPTFLAWERLRILYVCLIGLLTILVAGPSLVRFRTWVMILEGAVIANVAFFAGPMVETYVRWLGYDGKMLRWVLFVGGTLLTAVATVAAFAKEIPDQD